MDNKILELLEKIYIELQDTKKELKEDIKINREAIELNREAIELNTKSIVSLENKIENEVVEKIRGLYDSREVTNSKLIDMEEKFDDLKLDINNLAIKTINNDTRIIKITKDLRITKQQ